MPVPIRLIILAIVALIVAKVVSRHRIAGLAVTLLSLVLIGGLAFAVLVAPSPPQRSHHQMTIRRHVAERDLLQQKIELEAAMARLAAGERKLSIRLETDDSAARGDNQSQGSETITIVDDDQPASASSASAEVATDSDIDDIDSIMDEFAENESKGGDTDCEDCDLAEGTDATAGDAITIDDEPSTTLEQLVNRHSSDLYHYVAAKPKPDWIYDQTDTSGELHTMVVTVGPYENERQLLENFDHDLMDGVREYAKGYLARTGQRDSAWFGPIKLCIPAKPIRQRIIDTYDGVHLPSVEGAQPMPVKYVKLGFDSAFRDKIIDLHWQQSLSLARMLQTGIVSLGVLGMIGIVFAGLKVDTLTREKYPKARPLLSAAAFATVAALAVMVLIAAKR